MARFKVGDIIEYNTDDPSFKYSNGYYVVTKTRISKFSDNNEKFQDIECVPLGGNDTNYHFSDSLVNPNPYLSKISIL